MEKDLFSRRIQKPRRIYSMGSIRENGKGDRQRKTRQFPNDLELEADVVDNDCDRL